MANYIRYFVYINAQKRERAARMEGMKAEEDIAVIGFALKFPGDANTPESFWRMLLEEKSSMTDVPPDRFNINSFNQDKGGDGGIVSHVFRLYFIGITS